MRADGSEADEDIVHRQREERCSEDVQRYASARLRVPIDCRACCVLLTGRTSPYRVQMVKRSIR